MAEGVLPAARPAAEVIVGLHDGRGLRAGPVRIGQRGPDGPPAGVVSVQGLVAERIGRFIDPSGLVVVSFGGRPGLEHLDGVGNDPRGRAGELDRQRGVGREGEIAQAVPLLTQDRIAVRRGRLIDVDCAQKRAGGRAVVDGKRRGIAVGRVGHVGDEHFVARADGQAGQRPLGRVALAGGVAVVAVVARGGDRGPRARRGESGRAVVDDRRAVEVGIGIVGHPQAAVGVVLALMPVAELIDRQDRVSRRIVDRLGERRGFDHADAVGDHAAVGLVGQLNGERAAGGGEVAQALPARVEKADDSGAQLLVHVNGFQKRAARGVAVVDVVRGIAGIVRGVGRPGGEHAIAFAGIEAAEGPGSLRAAAARGGVAEVAALAAGVVRGPRAGGGEAGVAVVDRLGRRVARGAVDVGLAAPGVVAEVGLAPGLVDGLDHPAAGAVDRLRGSVFEDADRVGDNLAGPLVGEEDAERAAGDHVGSQPLPIGPHELVAGRRDGLVEVDCRQRDAGRGRAVVDGVGCVGLVGFIHHPADEDFVLLIGIEAGEVPGGRRGAVAARAVEIGAGASAHPIAGGGETARVAVVDRRPRRIGGGQDRADPAVERVVDMLGPPAQGIGLGQQHAGGGRIRIVDGRLQRGPLGVGDFRLLAPRVVCVLGHRAARIGDRFDEPRERVVVRIGVGVAGHEVVGLGAQLVVVPDDHALAEDLAAAGIKGVSRHISPLVGVLDGDVPIGVVDPLAGGAIRERRAYQVVSFVVRVRGDRRSERAGAVGIGIDPLEHLALGVADVAGGLPLAVDGRGREAPGVNVGPRGDSAYGRGRVDIGGGDQTGRVLRAAGAGRRIDQCGGEHGHIRVFTAIGVGGLLETQGVVVLVAFHAAVGQGDRGEQAGRRVVGKRRHRGRQGAGPVRVRLGDRGDAAVGVERVGRRDSIGGGQAAEVAGLRVVAERGRPAPGLGNAR